MADDKIAFSKDEIIKGLDNYPAEAVEQYASYCIKTALEKKKEGNVWLPKNEWMMKMKAEKLITFFKRVAVDSMYIDGKNITLSNRGIDYNYKAYKNKMFLVYPESKVDVQLVYKEDVFSFSKKSGEVFYSHDLVNPFDQKDTDVKGGYCVIKNRRGEFLHIMSKEDIEKCRKVAKTDKIWREWFKQMALKTVIKGACALHFSDIYQNIEDNDNENYNLENPVDIDIDYKSQIDDITELKKLVEFYHTNKDKFTKNPALLKYIQAKQAELKKAEEQKGE